MAATTRLVSARELGAKAQAREWIRQEIEATIDREGSASQPEITARAIAHFSEDAAFIRAFLAEGLRPLVYSVVQDVTYGSRVRVGDSVVERETLRGGVSVANSRWGTWLEHVGDRQIRLVDMTRDELLVAAGERERRGRHELVIAYHWRALAAGMETRTERVGMRFSAAEIYAAEHAAARAVAASIVEG